VARRVLRTAVSAVLGLAALFGLGTGAALGLVGGGGSILALPALVYGLGQPVSQAVPTSLLVVAASAAAGVVPRLRRGEVRWSIAAVFGGAGIGAAFAGTAVGRLLPDRVLLGLFASLMVVVGIRMLRGNPEPRGACTTGDGDVDWRSCLPRTLAAGLLVGFLTGLLGVGGGFVIVPALIWLLGLPVPVAVGTSLVILVVNAASGLAAHLEQARLDPAVSGAFVATALAAGLTSGRLAGRLDARQLSRGFATLVLVVAAFVAVQTVATPGALA